MLKVKDLVGIALISVCVFPLVLLGLLMALDVIRFEVGMSDEAKSKTNTYLRKYHPEQDEAEVKHMKTLEALKVKEKELETKESSVRREIERLENLRRENVELKTEIQSGKDKIEKLIASSEAMNTKKMKALAEVYGTMRPEEAAPILLTLDNKMVSEILSLIPEVRSQSKLMGAIGVLDVKRAAAISKLMGKISSAS